MIVYNLETDLNLLEINKKENERYSSLNQAYHYFFTAGDYEQFLENISLTSTNTEIHQSRYSIFDTFEYLFHKFKKGCFIQFRDKQMVTFLPFSKVNYENNWSHMIEIDPIFGKEKNNFIRFKKMLEYINKGTKYEQHDKKKYNFQRNFEEWYGNNGLFRFEYPLLEFDSGYSMLYDMFDCLSKEREIQNVDVFLNKRDYPLLMQDKTEPYYNLFGHGKPIELKYQKVFDNYIPILSMNGGTQCLDIKIPTWEDWRFFEYIRKGKLFMEKKNKSCKRFPNPKEFNNNFESKHPIAVFRGSSTGIGVTVRTNQRLFVCHVSTSKENVDMKDGLPLIDAKLSSFNRRPRKLMNDGYVRTIATEKLQHLIGNEMSYVEQSQYKYILHIPGHSCAYRLTIELFFGSVILYFPFETELWYFHMLKPYVHYVPMKAFDKESIFSTVKWCKENEEKCKEIAKNARDFADTYLNSEYALDYLAKTLNEISSKYPIVYNNEKEEKEKELQVYNEKHLKSLDSPLTNLTKEYWIHNFYFFQLYFRRLDLSGTLMSFLQKCLVKDNFIPSKKSVINLYHYKGLDFIGKKIKPNFRRDDLQQIFIGYHFVNKLYHRFPEHFPHTIYHVHEEEYSHVFLDYKQGSTLFKMLTKNQLQFRDLVLIWIEICCLLQIAQNFCGFIHNDLMTWNILIKKLDKPTNIFFEELNFGFTREYIPIIIDYGNSHMIYKSKNFYNTIPVLQVSPCTDVVFIIFKSLENFVNYSIETKEMDYNEERKRQNLESLRKRHCLIDDIKKILLFFGDDMMIDRKILRTYSINEYSYTNNRQFSEDVWRMRSFLKRRCKYSNLLERVDTFPNKTPMDFVLYLCQNRFVHKNSFFKRVMVPERRHLQGYMTPYFNFFMRNNLLHEIIQHCSYFITMNNDTQRFQKKIEDQLKKYLKLLCHVSTSSTLKNKVVLLFKQFYDEQLFSLVDKMKEQFQIDIFCSDVKQFKVPEFEEIDYEEDKNVIKNTHIPRIYFLIDDKNKELVDENGINFLYIKNSSKNKEDFFQRRFYKKK